MGRYLAILAIIALGVGFFSGLKVTKPGMVETGNNYLREYNFYDFRLLSSIGFDTEAVEEMRKQEHVLAADGSYYEDMIYEDADGKEKVLRAQSITEHVNTLELRDGRMPEADDECVVDAYQFKGQDIIGQEIEIADSNTQDTKDAFAHKKYKVVGTVNSPMYINIERGTTTLGNGRVSAFIFIPEDGFSFDAYKEIYVKSQYPSRNGRHGHVYTNHGKLNLFNAKYELDPKPIEEGCQCPACRHYSRAYIRHLLKAKEMLGMRLCVLHNLYFYNHLMEEIRDAIEAGNYKAFKKEKLSGFENNA